MYAIELKDFSCYYKNKKEYITALSHLNLKVNVGEFLVVVGESGSGKSTLIKACLGIADYYEGDLLVEGASVEHIDLKSGKFGYIRQEIALYPNLTVYENIAFPLRVIRTPQAEIDKRVKEIADIIGVRFLLTRKPRQLSGGQQQRIAIARALIKNPTILFCDEPFSNVEPTLRADLRIMFKKIHAHFNTTVVFVTHDIGEAFSLADRIVVLEDAKIVEEGTPEHLKNNGQSLLIKSHFGR